MKAKEFVLEYKKNRRAPKFNIKPRTGHAPTQTGAGAHRDKKKEQKQGYEKHKKSPVDESISYGQMPADAVRTLRNVYQRTSQGVEQYRDEEGASRIAKELNDAAKSIGVSQYMRNLYNSAARSAHMDFDTNPGDFKNWFPYVGDSLEALFKIHQEKGSYDDEEDVYPDDEKK